MEMGWEISGNGETPNLFKFLYSLSLLMPVKPSVGDDRETKEK